MKDKLKCIASAIGIGILILDSKTAIEGMQSGIQLCIQTVIPSLFPFLVLCGILTGTSGSWDIKPLRSICRLCKLPETAAPLLITGVLGGYPVGAKSVSQAYTTGKLTKQEAQRMLPLCNNCGPAFLFGMVSRSFTDPWSSFTLWMILMISMILTAQLLPASHHAGIVAERKRSITLPQALDEALHAMISICGWVIIFKMLISYLDRWILWYLPPAIKIVIIGSLELSNGCMSLLLVPDEAVRYILCAGMLAFGGLSVTMQTWSVISPELGKRQYLQGKTTQCGITILLAFLCQVLKRYPRITSVTLILSILAITISMAWHKKVRNRSRFSEQIHV